MIGKLFSKRYWWATLLVLAAMAVMIRLGVWQLERRQQRLAANADVVAKLEQPPLSLNEAALAAQWPLPQDRSAVRNVRASASGRFDFANQLLLLQQNLDATPGAHLIAPLLLDGTDQAVLVDRGWIPIEEAAGDWSQFNDETGQVTVVGFVQPSQILFGRAAENAGEQAAPEPSAEWHRVDIAAIQAQMPYELLPVYLLQAPPPQGNLTLPIRIEPGLDLSEGPHMSYALQWFAFAGILAIVYLRIVQTRGRQAASREPEENAPAQEAHHV